MLPSLSRATPFGRGRTTSGGVPVTNEIGDVPAGGARQTLPADPSSQSVTQRLPALSTAMSVGAVSLGGCSESWPHRISQPSGLPTSPFGAAWGELATGRGGAVVAV